MEAQRKFKLRRRVKTLRILAWSMIAFFVLFFTVTLIIRRHTEGDWGNTALIVILSGLLTPLFAGLMFTSYSQFALNELQLYKRDIQIFRSRKFATKAIEHLQMGELQQAVDTYISIKQYPERNLDDYLYGMIIQACYASTDEKLHKIGIQRVNKLKDTYDSQKVFKQE